MLRPQLFAFLLCFAAGTATSAPSLVADINTAINVESSSPTVLGALGSWTLFYTRSNFGEGALWRTDGTSVGTTKVYSGGDFRAYSDPHPGPMFVTLGGVGYFLGSDHTRGTQLWRTDGTGAGTRPVTSLPSSAWNGVSRVVGVVNSTLIVNTAQGLIRSDGTTDGTFLISDVGLWSADIPVVVGNRMFFGGDSRGSGVGRELWVTDGTAASTQLINDFLAGAQSSEPTGFVVVGNRLLFTVKFNINERRLWSMDLTSGVLTDLQKTFGLGGVALTQLNNTALFVGGNSGADFELWQTDGTVAGTVVVVDTDASPPSANSWGGGLIVVGNRAIFSAADQSGQAVWSTNGTAGQTVRLLNLTHTFGFGGALAVIDDKAYIKVGAPNSSKRIVQTDGTPAGTVQLPDVQIISPSTFARASGVPGKVFLLTYKDLSFPSAFHLWMHDSTTTRSTLITTIVGEPSMFTMLGSNLLFSGSSAAAGAEPWISDGTAASTFQLVDASPPLRNLGSNPGSFADVDGTLYFAADDGTNESRIWRSDGTLAGTTRVPGAAFPAPYGFFGVNDSVYFNSIDGGGASSLWILPPDGTPVKLADHAPLCSTCTGEGERAVLNGTLYFASTPGGWLWRSDGTPAGTQALVLSGEGWNATDLHVSGGRLYFTGSRANERGAWTSDGTAAGTCKLLDVNGGVAITVRNGVVHLWTSGAADVEIWRTDGTCGNAVRISAESLDDRPSAIRLYPTRSGLFFSGTVQISPGSPPQVPPIYARRLWFNALDGTSSTRVGGDQGTSATSIVIGSDLFFVGSDGSSLWASDGSAASTRLIFDVPGFIEEFGLHGFSGQFAFFAAGSGSVELWTSDGTTTGTRSRGSLIASPWPLAPHGRAVAASGSHLFFAHTDSVIGRELYALENEAPIAAADVGGNVEAGHSIQIDVISNDQDLDGSIAPASVRIVRQSSLGTATVAANGSVTYSPRITESGADSFAYVVKDAQGRDSNWATVSVTVQPSSAPPQSRRGGGGGAVRAADLVGALMMLLFSSWFTKRTRGRVHQNEIRSAHTLRLSARAQRLRRQVGFREGRGRGERCAAKRGIDTHLPSPRS